MGDAARTNSTPATTPHHPLIQIPKIAANAEGSQYKRVRHIPLAAERNQRIGGLAMPFRPQRCRDRDADERCGGEMRVG